MLIPTFRQIVNRPQIQKSTARARWVSSVANASTNLKPWTEIPGPKFYPFIGPLFSFLPGGEFHNLGAKFTRALYEKYGAIVKLNGSFGKNPLVFIYDAESTARINYGENAVPFRPGIESMVYYRRQWKNTPPELPTGLLTDNGEVWKSFRSSVNPVLIQPKTAKLYASIIDEITLEMVERIKKIRNNENMISDLDKEMNLWSLESAGVIALGCRIKCFEEKLDKDSPSKQLIDVVKTLLDGLEKLDGAKPSLWKYYPTKTFRKAMKNFERQECINKYFIERAKKELELNPKPDDQKGVLEKLIEINEDYAAIMASDMLTAGVDTVSISTLAALYLISANPEKQSKLRAELKSNDEKRPYLKACIKEAIRLLPVIIGSGRITTKEYDILGYKIPKNTSIIFVNQEMSRMDKYFPKPNEYIPERWMVNKEDPLSFKNGHPFAYGPFGFGVRSCIGRRIAELEMETFIGRMVENFELKWEGPPPKVVHTTINYIKGPYNLKFNDLN